MNTLQAQTAYIGSTEIKQVRLGNELVLAPNGDELWYKANELPSLDLRFADNKSLVDATTGQNLVTFTRASSGTYVDSQGVIQRATTNLLLRSEEFNNAVWVLNAAGTGIAPVLTANYATAPNGTLTAYRLQANRGAGNTSSDASNIVQAVSGLSDPHTVTISIWAKSNTGNSQSVYFRNNTGVGGSVIVVTTNWQRFSITGSRSGSSNNNIQIGSRGANNTDNSVDILIWGAQLEQSNTVGEYIPTTSTINSAPRFDHDPTTGESLGLLVEESRTNLNLYSEDFGNAIYSLTAATVSTNTAVAPDGTTTADTVTSSGTAIVSQSFTKAASAITYTGSLFVKGNSTDFSLTIDDGVTANRGRARFNLSTGTLGAVTNDGTFTGTTATITPFPNNWYRLTVTTTTNTLTTVRLRSFWSGTGTSTDFWGAQLETGAFATSYIPTTTAAVTRSADVASITGSNFGVSRTNLLLQSNGFDTTWTNSLTTETANAGTAPDGTNAAWELKDTVDATASQHLLSQTPASFVSGTTYSYSVWAKSGTLTHIALTFPSSAFTSTLTTRYSLQTGAAVSVAAGTTATVTAFPNGWYRVTTTATATTSASGALNIRLALAGTTLYQGDGTGTILIWGAQLEVGSTATAYIPTTTAAVTVFESPWYRQDEGTIYSEHMWMTTSDFGTVWGLDDATGNNETRLIGWNSGTDRAPVITVGGTGQIQWTNNSYSANILYRYGIAYKQNDVASSRNGALPLTDDIVSLPSVTRLAIGSTRSTAFELNGTIRRLTYFPTRLANETLQRITQ